MKNKEDPDPRKLIPVLLFFITLLFYSFSCSEKVRLFIHVVEDGGSDGIPFASLLCISENGDSSFNYSDMEGIWPSQVAALSREWDGVPGAGNH